VKRKSIIGTALALVVAAILAVAFWTPDTPPVVSIAYESVSDRDAGQVWFRLQTTVTNTTSFRAYELQWTDNRWQVVAGSDTRHIYIREPSTFGLLRTVPQGGHTWRMALEYQPTRDKTALWQIRRRLWMFALKKRWSNLSGWLNPMKPEILYGPKMRGNKPVEKE
jgi:hypothetical protein